MIHAYYHWWSESEDGPPYANMRVPVLLSIATLRAVNSDIPITLIDRSREPNDWLHFPEKLNFDVVSDTSDFYFEEHQEEILGYKYLSRIFELMKLNQDETIMYVDSDCFWFHDPLPLAGETDKLCVDGWNTGFFYFDRTQTEWFDVFQAYVKASIHSEELRNIIKKQAGYEDWHVVVDEHAISYMVQNNPELLCIIPDNEHINGSKLDRMDDTVKMLHCNGIMVANRVAKILSEKEHSRGLMALVIKEFYENASKVLDEKDFGLIFTDRERDLYLPQQFSLLEDTERLLETRRADGHYHLDRCLSAPTLI